MDDLRKWIWGAVGTAALAVAAWGSTFVSDSAVAAIDRHYLVRVEFDKYLQAQTYQANQSQYRAIDQRIVEIESEIQYGNLTDQRRAQLELQLKNLQIQKDEIKLELDKQKAD